MSQQGEYALQIGRILQKLEEARSRQLTCYGSDSHDFRLNARLSEAELQVFEARAQVQLPEDYCAFLTLAGNGGAGPYNGIFPLKEWDDFADWVVDDCPDHFLALPCPLYRGLLLRKDWRKHLNGASPYQGTLSIGSQGCAFATQLIVSGPCRGQILYVDADDNRPPYIVHEPNFLSWYERWLDELLQGYESGWFGYGPGGGEDNFLRILNDPESDDDFKAEAAFAFCRLPLLSDNATHRINEYLDHTDAGVRAGTLATIRHFELSGFLNRIDQRLEDSSAEVRWQAVTTVMKFDPQSSTEAVLRRLREDSDPDVLRAAFYSLDKAEELTKEELLRILDDPKRRSLRALAAGAIQWDTEDEPLLVHLLRDSDRYVRSVALAGLEQIMGRNSLPTLLELLSREQDVNIVGHILKAFGEFGETSTVPVLLEWLNSNDDFHRLEALESLVKIGDERAVKPAQAMLQEQRKPIRKDERGSLWQTHYQTIRELVRQSLAQSPNQTLRRMAD